MRLVKKSNQKKIYRHNGLLFIFLSVLNFTSSVENTDLIFNIKQYLLFILHQFFIHFTIQLNSTHHLSQIVE